MISFYSKVRQFQESLEQQLQGKLSDEIWYGTLLASKNRYIPFYKNLSALEQGKLQALQASTKESLSSLLKVGLKQLLWSRKAQEKRKKLDQKFKNQKIIAIKTFLYSGNYTNNTFNDPFFGELTKEFQSTSLVIVDPLLAIAEGMDVINQDNHLICWQAYLHLADVIDTLKLVLNVQIPELKLTWGKQDIGEAVKNELEGQVYHQSFFLHQLMRKAYARMAQSFQIEKLIMTYENNAWERMLTLSFRQHSSPTKIIGFQHSSVCHGSLNYQLTTKEQSILPDQIYVTGELVKQLFINEFHHPKDLLQISPALRYTYFAHTGNPSKKKSRGLLVALEGGKHSLQVLEHLVPKLDLLKQHDYSVTLRFHPAWPYEEAKKYFNFSQHPSLNISQNAKTQNDLDAHSVLLYTSTTVSLEALRQGLYIIKLADEDLIDTDPIIGKVPHHFIWDQRQSLEIILKKIEALSQDVHDPSTITQYLDSYLSPASSHEIQSFAQRLNQ